MEHLELQATLAAYAAEVALKEQALRAKQQNEMEVLLQRAAQGRDDLRKTRALDLERCQQVRLASFLIYLCENSNSIAVYACKGVSSAPRTDVLDLLVGSITASLRTLKNHIFLIDDLQQLSVQCLCNWLKPPVMLCRDIRIS